jgi:hypothetical protein
MAEKGWSSAGRTKHIDIKYFWITEKIKEEIVEIDYLPTDDMVADVLTKPLKNEKFKKIAFRLIGKL